MAKRVGIDFRNIFLVFGLNLLNILYNFGCVRSRKQFVTNSDQCSLLMEFGFTLIINHNTKSSKYAINPYYLEILIQLRYTVNIKYQPIFGLNYKNTLYN